MSTLCDDRCWYARTPVAACGCVCKGARHGKGAPGQLGIPVAAGGPRCIAYDDNGRICPVPAVAVDPARGGMVCEAHLSAR